MPDEVNAITQIKACLEKMSKSAALSFTIFRLGSRDFPLFIRLYSCVTYRWWQTEYDDSTVHTVYPPESTTHTF